MSTIFGAKPHGLTPNDSGTRGFVPVVDFIPGQDDLSIAAQDQILKSWQISRASGQVREADPPTSKDLLRLLAIHCQLAYDNVLSLLRLILRDVRNSARRASERIRQHGKAQRA